MKAYNADSITVLEGLDPVRKRPGMYIGSTSTKGLNHLIFEIVDNSVDEHLSGHCDTIIVTLNKDGSATIEDNGRGIPVDIHAKGYPAERIIFTTLHAGGKFDNSNYKTSGGLHGVGSSVVNALSSKMIVTIKKDGYIYYDEYAFGKPTIPLKKNELLPNKGKTKETGTTVTFFPDESIFDTIKFKANSIEQRLHETAYLNPNLTLIFRNDRDNEPEKIFHETEGLKGFINSLNANKETITPIAYVSGEKDNVVFECSFQYTNDFGDTIVGFCNNINTIEGGTHIDGFKTAFARILNQYARDLGTLKEKDANFTGNDTRNGMVCVISIKHPSPRFEGQTKTKLDNTDAKSIIQSILNTELQVYFDRNVEILKSIISNAEKSAKLRREEEKIKTNISDKKFSFEGNGKLAKQESNDSSKCEIFIVEGKSAGGSAKTARNRKYQAILPIRGKILNVEKQTLDKILDNAEIKALINAFGCGFSSGLGNDFDIKKLNYDKIIILSDADVDGAHISTLLLTFFYRFMPELIYNGKVYRAMPPLYKIEEKSGKKTQDIYLYDDNELSEYRKKHKGNLKIQRYKGLGEMDAQQLWETTMNPETRKLKQIEIDDVVDANSTTSVLMGNDIVARREFIMGNSNLSQN